MVIQYLLDNQEYLKEKTLPLALKKAQQLQDNPLFQIEIDNQYLIKVQSLITDEITSRLSVSTEEVLLVLNDIDLKEYLK